ncbi:hypothetical protein HNP84_010284 [Thermocatellispora tengchongensis]|uniref:Uncharacterized protein n=1 Tax=Thermocatellispora tengchongensis TaxID=1073253 RepID=A0A840PNR9_9ACTN|nr:hypothetical protein [Thermocatellispora tengchongensis]MBB5140516.1 hypothetical protein [Thermocatellispora tengchongensis]
MIVVANILAAIGALSVLAAAGLVVLALLAQRTERRRLRSNRDHRATRPAERVAADPAMWSDFFLDHDLHKVIKPPEEWR